ncbi:CcdB family protein [uncultured Sphingomonas sp.]|uniref:CcdB family protein n=1 Tax=uncultured Sphingomonas sp. TaxID=158754 RepID=UPI00261F20F9|nr:CcdB family protein [uncultured Sphingomonas sp.]
MAKFDVYPAEHGSYWLDCQADLLRGLNTRFVVPLRPAEEHAGGDARLNPVFAIAGEPFVMLTHFAAAVPVSAMTLPIASLAAHEYEIGVALDRLIGGY